MGTAQFICYHCNNCSYDAPELIASVETPLKAEENQKIDFNRKPTESLRDEARKTKKYLKDSYRKPKGFLQGAYRIPIGNLKDSYRKPKGFL